MRQIHMTVFSIDSTIVAGHTAALRRDANNLHPLNVAPVPAAGPLAVFSEALALAVDTANTRAQLLNDEARRIADVMDTTVTAAGAVDNCLCAQFGATL